LLKKFLLKSVYFFFECFYLVIHDLRIVSILQIKYILLSEPTLSNLKVFVYGTLKPGEYNYQRYCEGKVVEEKRAIAFGQLFNLPLGYPAMTLGESPVQGFVLTFSNPAFLDVLDELEDYNPHRTPEENEYIRQQIETYNLSGQSLGLAWVYLMTVEQVQRFGGVLMPSGWWSGYVDTLTQ
jgi:gamma-glutamylcyclotransferase (GGCT)/AIG2-like uncharacterized protein YtfP